MTNATYFTTLLNFPGRGLVFDAARPYLVVEARNMDDMLGLSIVRVVSSHPTSKAAKEKLVRIQ